MHINPYVSVMECNEMVEMIAVQLTWSSLVALSNTNRGTRDVVRGLIRSRMRFFLSRFFDWAHAPTFFDLLESTNACVVGSVVRCTMSVDAFHLYRDIYPLQLNVVVPLNTLKRLQETGTPDHRKWRRFFTGCGYKEESGAGPVDVPQHLTATSQLWSVMSNDIVPIRKISLIQSRTRSALSPILQTCHTSNFFALSATRIYCLYPKLFAAKVNLNTKERWPVLQCALDSFNFGLLSFTRTDNWLVFPDGGCSEACPSMWRHMKGLKGIGMFRWGGFNGTKDTGLTVSKGDSCEGINEIWKLQGECCNPKCPAIVLCTNLLQAIV